MKIGWLCLSGIGASETFLSDTLEQLAQVGQVVAVSGVSSGLKSGEKNHHYIPFNEHRLKLWHTLRKKFTGRNVHRAEVQARCLKMTQAVWEEFKPDVFWVEFGTTAVAAKQVLRSSGKPYFIAVHGYDITTEFKDEDYRSQLVALANAPNCRGVVCASHYTKRLCVLAGVDSGKCHVIRLGLNGDLIKRDETIEKTAHPSFVHFGRLTEKKHPIATLEAFKLVAATIPEATLTFIGDGPLKSELLERIEGSAVKDRVRCLGAMERAEALKEVQRHWVFVQHSVTAKSGDQEGFALSPAEAALMEMPVISTWHNGIPEHVIDGETGFLVNEFDYESMAERMVKLARDEGLRAQMGAAGRSNVQAVCDPTMRLDALSALMPTL